MSSNNPQLAEEVLKRIAHKRCIVAVSGGSDSLALLNLLIEQSSAELDVVSVDHGLRAQARAEAEFVKDFCQARDLPHHILSVDVDENGNMQAQARQSRYRALAHFAHETGIEYLLLGHTLDDQIESFFLSALRGSGVDGLAAMPLEKAGQPKILRPMLYLRRAALQAYLRDQNLKWVEDPSNKDENFDRVKIRKWVLAGESIGLNFEKIIRTTQNMARLSEYVHHEVFDAALSCLDFSVLYVEARMNKSAFFSLHKEMQLRLLAKLCQFYGGSIYKPRLNSVDDLRNSLQSQKGRRSLEKTDFGWDQEMISICAEAAYLPAPKTGRLWSRFEYKGAYVEEMKIGAIRDRMESAKNWQSLELSKRAARSLPALFHGDALILADWNDFDCLSFWEFCKIN